MSETPIEPDNDPTQPATDPGEGSDIDPVQAGEPATGPEAPVPPGGSEDADEPGGEAGGSGTGGPSDL